MILKVVNLLNIEICKAIVKAQGTGKRFTTYPTLRIALVIINFENFEFARYEEFTDEAFTHSAFLVDTPLTCHILPISKVCLGKFHNMHK